MFKSLTTLIALSAALIVAGCSTAVNKPSTEIARATVNGETYILYDTHHGIGIGGDIYDIRWASNDRHFRSYISSSDKSAIRRLEKEIATGLTKWANCEGAGQYCPKDDDD